jgi:hypothetical protein
MVLGLGVALTLALSPMEREIHPLPLSNLSLLLVWEKGRG